MYFSTGIETSCITVDPFIVLKRNNDAHNSVGGTGPAGFCNICPRKKNRRSKKKCISCEVTVCNEHVVFMCQKCYN